MTAPAQRKSVAISGKIQAVAFSVLFVLIIMVMLWNTSTLDRVLKRSTEAYVQDVTYQLTSDIASRLHTNLVTLQQLSDSIPRLASAAMTEDFLQRKAEIVGFDALVVLNRQGDAIPGSFDIQAYGGLSALDASFQGETAVAYADGQSLLFSAPIPVDGAIDQILVGVRGKENMQRLIQPISFDGHGMSCIVNSAGEVVISPTDLKPFLQLDDLFQAEISDQTFGDLYQMNQDLSAGRDGAFLFTAIDRSQLVMSYQPLGVEDWSLLTLVPADLISAEASQYVLRSFFIVGGITVIFIVLFAAVVASYRRNRRSLEKIAFTDPLTGGMNDAAFQLAYENLVQGDKPMQYSVVMLNVRGFKLVNANYGIETGSETLRRIDAVLRTHLQPRELLARCEADHFFLCLREHETQAITQRLALMAKQIIEATEEIFTPYTLSLGWGACLIDDPALHVTILQDRARAACQHPAAEGGACVFFSDALLQQLRREQELDALFSSSLENGDFHLFLQPKVRLADDRVSGAEALVRWMHPELGPISPGEFIPFFEKSGKICQLDLYIFEKACQALAAWVERGVTPVPISVNLSRAHFRKSDFLRAFHDIKQRYHIPDGMIELELTESIFFTSKQIAHVKQVIEKMHAYGFLCSLDDFGVGYSSLGLLKEFDVDTIKLDRQFFGNIAHEKAQKIIASFIELAGKLKIHVVAEGIETDEQLDFLRSIGCEMVQGFIYSKPLPAGEFDSWRLQKDAGGQTKR